MPESENLNLVAAILVVRPGCTTTWARIREPNIVRFTLHNLDRQDFDTLRSEYLSGDLTVSAAAFVKSLRKLKNESAK